jgi:general secretion pathway protein G
VAATEQLAVKLRYPNSVRLFVKSIARRVGQAPATGGRPARRLPSNTGRRHSESGVTLLELIIATSILLVLATAALPVVRFGVQRQKEAQLHKALREIRDAIDHYKDYADRNLIRVEVGSEGYPPDLDTLVKPIQIGAGSDRKVRFLRRIPIDPMTGRAEWNLQAVQDDPDSTSWGGKNVFDVHSKSQGTALDGTRYADW